MSEVQAGPRRMLLTVPEAMERLNVSRTVLYELIRSSRLVTVTVGRRRLVPVGEVENYVARLVAEAVERGGHAA